MRNPALTKPPIQQELTVEQDNRSYRQIEDYYKRHGYQPQSVEQMAEGDFQLVKRLKGRTRTPLNLNLLKGVEN